MLFKSRSACAQSSVRAVARGRHARLVAGDQHEIMAPVGEAFGIGSVNPGRGAGDQDFRSETHGSRSHGLLMIIIIY
jgi:hypothetical protein